MWVLPSKRSFKKQRAGFPLRCTGMGGGSGAPGRRFHPCPAEWVQGTPYASGRGRGGGKRKQTKKKTKKTPRRWACRPPTYDAGIRLLPGFNQPRLGLWCRGTGTRHREVSWAGDSLCQGYKSTHGLQKTAGQPLAHRAPTCGCIRRQRTLAPPTSAAGALISVPIDGPHD